MNIKNIILVGFFALISLSYQPSTKDYPKSYFRSPVSGPIQLSGSCGELRPNHFHMGIDIKPQDRNVAEPIYAAAEGFITRIVVLPKGYGNGIYIQHPNGYTTVYGHLKTFNDKINQYVKDIQYQNKTFSVDLENLSPDLFPIYKGEIIGEMGNSGSSGGAHLHFEIRDTKTQHALNPLLFGLTVKDDVPPRINRLKVYWLNHKHETEQSKIYDVQADKTKGVYRLSPSTVVVQSGRVGLGINTFDFMTGVTNWNGPYSIKMYQDDVLKYHFDTEKFSFDEWYYLNAHVDYKEFKKNNNYFNRCYLLPGNGNTTVYKEAVNKGVLEMREGQTSKIRFEIMDVSGNQSTLNFDLKKEGTSSPTTFPSFNYILPYKERSIIRLTNMELDFPENSFYEDVYLSYSYTTNQSKNTFSGVHHIHDKYIPVHNYFKIKLKPEKTIPENLKKKALIVKCEGTDAETGYPSEWDGDFLTAETRAFGDYCVMIDTLPPTITNVSFNANMSGQTQFTFKIEDNLAGVQTYNAWVNDQWILMEYDKKSDSIHHFFDNKISRGAHRFKLVVSDGRGNAAVFEDTFVY
jgi:hypothetical protein